MGFNYGYEKKKFDSRWKRLEVEYCDAGMSEEQIAAMKEYDRFEKGSANSNASTRVLQRQLEDRDEKGGFHPYKIIITTIQKLDNFVTKNKGHEVFNKHCVIIFDECHRS